MQRSSAEVVQRSSAEGVQRSSAEVVQRSSAEGVQRLSTEVVLGLSAEGVRRSSAEVVAERKIANDERSVEQESSVVWRCCILLLRVTMGCGEDLLMAGCWLRLSLCNRVK